MDEKVKLEIEEYKKYSKETLLSEIFLLRERLRLAVKEKETLKTLWHEEMDKRISRQIG